jgi:GNAT superfamily N-acetyltransferase
MTQPKALRPPLEVQPLTPERWSDLEAVLGENGVQSGCWCMWWRLPRSQYKAQKGQANKEAFHAIVASGEIPGLLAYRDGQPIAWCAIAPREHYPSLERSRTLKKIDEEQVWSITCLFVAKPFRGQGVMLPLLQAAIEYARMQGAAIVEGYPFEPEGARLPDVFGATGLVSTFRQAGFVEVSRPSPKQSIMRYRL